MESTNNIFLVPTDFSEVCGNAAEQAAAAAKNVGYKVALLHVIDKNTKAELKKENKGLETIEQRLEKIASSLSESYGVEVETIAREGDIFSTIAEVAQEIKADLIFLGTHGKVGMQKLTGSFALRVVTSSEVPSIIVQKKKLGGGFSRIVIPITSDAGPWNKTKWAARIARQFDSEIHLFHLPGDDRQDTVAELAYRDAVVRFLVRVRGWQAVTELDFLGTFFIDHCRAAGVGLVFAHKSLGDVDAAVGNFA